MGHRPGGARLARPEALRHQGDAGLTRANRVLPTGEIVAHPGRGDLMGNRGCLHDAEGRLTRRRWTTQAWIACRLKFKGRRRTLMTPGRYTELYFLDEATAFAAGHRPCAECRRKDYSRFKTLWAEVHHSTGALGMDRTLHAARIPPLTSGSYPERPVDTLPDGAFVRWEGASWLLWQGALLRHTPSGYTDRQTPPPRALPVLTPQPLLELLAAGYPAAVHATAR